MADPAAPRRRIAPQPVPVGAAFTAQALQAASPLSTATLAASHRGPTDPSTCSTAPGRRLVVDISETYKVNYKKLLRKNGVVNLDSKLIPASTEEVSTSAAITSLGSGGEGPLTALVNKLQRIYTAGDKGSDSEDSEVGSEGGEGSSGSDREGEGDNDDDDSSSEEEDLQDKDTADLDERKANKKCRAGRSEAYEADFIDDTELIEHKKAKRSKSKYSGFWINQGPIELLADGPPPRHPVVRKPRPSGAAPGLPKRSSGPKLGKPLDGQPGNKSILKAEPDKTGVKRKADVALAAAKIKQVATNQQNVPPTTPPAAAQHGSEAGPATSTAPVARLTSASGLSLAAVAAAQGKGAAADVNPVQGQVADLGSKTPVKLRKPAGVGKATARPKQGSVTDAAASPSQQQQDAPNGSTAMRANKKPRAATPRKAADTAAGTKSMTALIQDVRDKMRQTGDMLSWASLQSILSTPLTLLALGLQASSSHSDAVANAEAEASLMALLGPFVTKDELDQHLSKLCQEARKKLAGMATSIKNLAAKQHPLPLPMPADAGDDDFQPASPLDKALVSKVHAYRNLFVKIHGHEQDLARTIAEEAGVEQGLVQLVLDSFKQAAPKRKPKAPVTAAADPAVGPSTDATTTAMPTGSAAAAAASAGVGPSVGAAGPSTKPAKRSADGEGPSPAAKRLQKAKQPQQQPAAGSAVAAPSEQPSGNNQIPVSGAMPASLAHAPSPAPGSAPADVVGEGSQEVELSKEMEQEQCQQCIEAAEKLGAPTQIVAEGFTAGSKSLYNKVAYKVLCHAGPQGLSTREIITQARERKFTNWVYDNNKNSYVNQALKTLISSGRVAHVGGYRYALAALPGVVHHAKPERKSKTKDAAAQAAGGGGGGGEEAEEEDGGGMGSQQAAD